MKKIIKISIILLLCAIIGVTLTNATSNEKLPTKEDVTTFVTEMKSSSASDIFSKVKEAHPAWNADLLSCGNNEAVALYYTDANSSKGYGSLYFKDGEIVTPSSLGGYTLKESFKGELDENNTSNPSDDNESTIIKDDETEKNSNYTYDAFKTALNNYDGSFSCKNQSCATSLMDYFKGLGWGSEVKYCVAVNTSDEGTVYVVLGV